MDKKITDSVKEIMGPSGVKLDEKMSGYTSFRVGGPADILVEPDIDKLASLIKLCKKADIPYTVLGNGSNVLVGDKGIRGLVIIIGKGVKGIEIDGHRVRALAGELLSSLSHKCAEFGLSGLEFASGIPGSVGGAVVMNAGAYDGQMKDVIISANAIDSDGNMHSFKKEEMGLDYRKSIFLDSDYIVTQIECKLQKLDPNTINNRMKELTALRNEKQPIEYPSAGSTFKRPTGYFAGKLIEDANLKGYRIGGACVSTKHAGFIINDNNASAKDILDLINAVTHKVKEAFGVELEPEVRIIGEF